MERQLDTSFVPLLQWFQQHWLDHHYWGPPTSHDGSEHWRPLPLVLEDGSQKDKKESGGGEKKKDPKIHVTHCYVCWLLCCVTFCVSWFCCLGEPLITASVRKRKHRKSRRKRWCWRMALTVSDLRVNLQQISELSVHRINWIVSIGEWYPFRYAECLRGWWRTGSLVCRFVWGWGFWFKRRWYWVGNSENAASPTLFEVKKRRK